MFRARWLHWWILLNFIHFDIWQNWYSYVRFKNKIKLKKKLTEKKKHKSISNIQYYFSKGWREGEQKKKYGEYSDKEYATCCRGTDESNQFFSLIWGESPAFWHMSENGFDFIPAKLRLGLPWWLSSKESICQCRIWEFDPWIRKILEKEMTTQYSCLGNPMDEELGRLQVHGIAETSDTTNQLNNRLRMDVIYPYGIIQLSMGYMREEIKKKFWNRDENLRATNT